MAVRPLRFCHQLSYSRHTAQQIRTTRTPKEHMFGKSGKWKPIAVSAVMFFFAAVNHVACADYPIGAGDAPGGDYKIGPEDTLQIDVWKEKDLQREVLVRPDGWITFPLVGNISARGKTAQQVQDEITTRLRKYISDPDVTVSVKKVAGYKIFVMGKVGKPGEFSIGRYVDVLQALTLAGGLTPFADEGDIKILRRENGEDSVFRFDYDEVRKGKNLGQNIILQSGDTIIVP
jgi:polysaccharide biosynthesis/export protein